MGRPARDIKGRRFGRLLVLERDGSTATRASTWKCLCDCGNVVILIGINIGKTTYSCGCLKSEMMSDIKSIHGKSDKPIYKTWASMKQRCYYKNSKSYYRYGGRGITVCDEWRDNPSAFIEWAMKNGYSKDKQLDRIDNNGNYEPLNCRFVSTSKNCRNRSNNRRISAFGKTLCAIEWQELTGIGYGTILYRINNGWSIEKALTKKPNHKVLS